MGPLRFCPTSPTFFGSLLALRESAAGKRVAGGSSSPPALSTGLPTPDLDARAPSSLARMVGRDQGSFAMDRLVPVLRSRARDGTTAGTALRLPAGSASAASGQRVPVSHLTREYGGGLRLLRAILLGISSTALSVSGADGRPAWACRSAPFRLVHRPFEARKGAGSSGSAGDPCSWRDRPDPLAPWSGWRLGRPSGSLPRPGEVKSRAGSASRRWFEPRWA